MEAQPATSAPRLNAECRRRERKAEQKSMDIQSAAPEALPPVAAIAPSAIDDLVEALGNGAILVDVRPPVSSEAIDGVLRMLSGAISSPFADGAMSIDALPVDKKATLILNCRSGNRAGKACAFLLASGYTSVLNGGGPLGPAEQWQALAETRGELVIPMHGGGLHQLFDGDSASGGSGSSTLSYILTDEASKEAIIIDPVLEQVERDLAVIDRLGCRLVLALNTHCHADHVTGSGMLKAKVGPGLQSCISKSAGARADRLLDEGELVRWADGKRNLKVPYSRRLAIPRAASPSTIPTAAACTPATRS